MSIKQHTKINCGKKPEFIEVAAADVIFTAGTEIRILVSYSVLVVRGNADRTCRADRYIVLVLAVLTGEEFAEERHVEV